jgi:hypothetical protein
VLVPSNTATVVTHITLDSGVWMVGGQINYVSTNVPVGTFFILGNILVGGGAPLPPDATAALQSQQVLSAAILTFNVGLPPREIDVAAGTDVFLVASIVEHFPDTSQGASAWGFISAVKIRNHGS